jgi:predicted methyltransferase
MKKAFLLVLALAATPLACEETPPPVAPPPPPPPAETAVVAAPVETAKPAEPTPEEKKKAEEEKKKAEAAAKLAADRAQWEAESKADAARWTPDMHAAANKLASTKYPNIKAALTAALKGPQRKPTSAARDAYRHPLETLEFFGLKPDMTVLEYGPGEGWYTELLAPVLAAKGKLYITASDPNGPPESRGTFYGQRTRRFLDVAPEVFGKVETVLTAGGPPKIGMENKLDMVIATRELHGMHQNKMVPAFLAEVFTALKPGGVLGIEQHRAPEGANPDESAKKGYLPEAWVIAQAEAAGFKLGGKSEVNANDHDKYAAIGESDRMTLKFVKPGPAKAAGKPAKPKK